MVLLDWPAGVRYREGMPVRTLLFRPDQRPVEVESSCASWAALVADADNLIWIDAESPNNDDLAGIAQSFTIDARALDIRERVSRRAMVRVFRDHYLVRVIAIDVREDRELPRILTVEIDTVVGRNFLVSMHARPLPFAAALEERTVTNPYLGRFDASYLLCVLLDSLIGNYSTEFDEVEDRVERLEEQFLRDPSRKALDQATTMKRHILNLRHLIAPHREAFGILVAADIPMIQEEHDDIYFRDLLLHLDSFLERLDHARDVLTGAYDLYISNISERTNQQLKVLTFLSSVLLPMTVVTGIFGTNFALTEYRSWEPFYLMLVGMGLMAVGMLAFFRWRDWL